VLVSIVIFRLAMHVQLNCITERRKSGTTTTNTPKTAIPSQPGSHQTTSQSGVFRVSLGTVLKIHVNHLRQRGVITDSITHSVAVNMNPSFPKL
jgi:hypothetical protein